MKAIVGFFLATMGGFIGDIKAILGSDEVAELRSFRTKGVARATNQITGEVLFETEVGRD